MDMLVFFFFYLQMSCLFRLLSCVSRYTSLPRIEIRKASVACSGFLSSICLLEFYFSIQAQKFEMIKIALIKGQVEVLQF
ncbi:hypothetical protein ig2599ANME_0061 [groundwater metagenome]